jgi:DNA invertase Pin-like site-specific DNA recombinase
MRWQRSKARAGRKELDSPMDTFVHFNSVSSTDRARPPTQTAKGNQNVTTKKYYSTVEVARAAGVTKRTLFRWLADKKIKEPKKHSNGGQEVRLWTDADKDAVIAFKNENYGQGKGPRKKK